MAYRVRDSSTDRGVLEDINEIPDMCPACDHAIEPIFCYQFGVDTWREYDGFLQVVFRCPRVKCQRLFIALYGAERGYRGQPNLVLRKSYLMDVIEFEEFSEIIANVSSKFAQIYNQAKAVEDNNLLLIAGPGYRKALEFLVKDYLIKSNPENHDKIKKMQLRDAIKLFTDARIEACASRAAWLGNDETHYVRKWEDRDLHDLKTLIKMVVDWIDLVERSKEYVTAMPSPPPPGIKADK